MGRKLPNHSESGRPSSDVLREEILTGSFGLIEYRLTFAERHLRYRVRLQPSLTRAEYDERVLSTRRSI